MTAGREAWSGRLGFILATVGSAVGIGSIWKFPYEVGANGGSAFILFYLVGLVACAAVPAALRRARRDRHHHGLALSRLTQRRRQSFGSGECACVFS